MHHPEMAAGGWSRFSLMEQLANVGSEVYRAMEAKRKGDASRLQMALERALELFDLTLADPRWRGRYKEIARAREVVCDFLVGDNQYSVTAEELDRYFLQYAVAARNRSPAA